MIPRQTRDNQAPRAGDSARLTYEVERAQWRADRFRLSARVAVWLVPVAALFGLFVGAVTHFGAFGLISAVLVLAAAADVLRVRPISLEAYRERADGEARTAHLLRPLERRGFRLLHDRVLTGDDDFAVPLLAVGPTGVYLIDSRNWMSGPSPRLLGAELWRGHQPQAADLASLRARARQLTNVLMGPTGDGIVVTPLLAVHTQDLAGTPRDLGGLIIVQRDQLVRILEGRPLVWRSDTVRSVADRADTLLAPRSQPSAPLSLAP
jgi:hypothetical protein